MSNESEEGDSGMESEGRLLTGDRPTGKLHLGHYVGSIANRVRLQDEYTCYFLVADYHVLTTAYQDPRGIGENVRELVLDYLSVGIDPERSTIYLQSLVPEVCELFLLAISSSRRLPTGCSAIRSSRPPIS